MYLVHTHFPNITTNWTRWLYCVECPQYSTRLEALGYLCDCVSGRVQRQQVVKVICHKAHRCRRRMVQCYSIGDGKRVFPQGHIGATWRVRLNLCIPRPTGVHNRNGKWIGLAVFAQLTAESAYTLQWAPLYTRIAPSHGGYGPPM